MKTYKLPLLKNHHSHPSIFAALQNGMDISGIKDKAEVMRRLSEQSRPFNLVLGWNNSFFSLYAGELDHFPAMLVCNVSFHEFLLNKAARDEYAKDFTELTTHIDNTDWVERNLHQVLKFIAKAAAIRADDIEKFYEELAVEGVWYAEDMLLPGGHMIDQYKKAGCDERTRFWADMDSFEAMPEASRADISGIKLFLDGAVGVKTAALKKAYLSGEEGLLLHSESSLRTVIEKAAGYGKPIAVHSIGDGATDQFISVLETIKKNGRALPPQIRMEHCQFITQDLAQRAGQLGIILSMQPNFSEDSRQYLDRLPAGYDRRNNPFRMLIDRAGFRPGKTMFFGSDGPPHSVEYAVKSALFPPLESQRLTMEEFIAGYCMPDFEHGYSTIEVDIKNQSVTVRTVLN